MNRRDIKTKNKIAIADTDNGTDEELKPLHVQRGFKESDSNGLNKNFGMFILFFQLDFKIFLFKKFGKSS